MLQKSHCQHETPESGEEDGAIQRRCLCGRLRTSLLAQLFSCQRTPRRPTSPSMQPDRPTPHAERPRRGHAWPLPPALPASLNAPAWLSQNVIAVNGGPPGATALSCSHPPQAGFDSHAPVDSGLCWDGPDSGWSEMRPAECGIVSD
jgi:hypothetical protein